MEAMDSQATAVIIPYSHAGLSLVAPVAKLLRVNQSLVFQDIDQIRPDVLPCHRIRYGTPGTRNRGKTEKKRSSVAPD